jgi:TRAP-type C4-dicarboxylate transport system substrate-binding protein
LSGFFESYDNVVKGNVDMALSMPGMYPNILPLEDVFSLVDYQVKVQAWSRMANDLTAQFPEMQKAYTDSGTHLIFKVVTFPNVSMFGKGKNVQKLADMKGLKYLSTGPWDAATWEALGMVPLSMMPQDTFLDIQTGVCDGGTFTLPLLWEMGLGEVCPYVVETNVRPGVFVVTMNLKKWNILSAANQKIITDAAANIPAAQDAQQWKLWATQKAQAIKEFGTTFSTFSEADLYTMNQLTIPVKAKFVADMTAAGYTGQKLLDTALSLEKKYADSQYAPK